jgi:NAD(P)-dependent dehydrogenase (short-subunit alcohol dehydrogenase family)
LASAAAGRSEVLPKMPVRLPEGSWALILGGSSGFGLATAHQLSSHGTHLCVVHRDRRGAMARIQPEFDAIRARGVSLLALNDDALSAERREAILDQLAPALGERGRVRLLLHSIAFGNLKLVAREAKRDDTARAALARALGLDEARLAEAVDRLFDGGEDTLASLASAPAYPAEAFIGDEDLQQTIHAMGTSLLGWVQALHRRGMFAADARVVGLTSEGNEVAWKGYAAVAAAKVALESISRAIAVEMAPYGIRSNIVQAGVTDTPALRLIPGSAQLKAAARRRNPFARLTTPEDVARVIHLLCLPEAAWINGALIRVDGGEHVSGASR